jgi:hypothetical protein
MNTGQHAAKQMLQLSGGLHLHVYEAPSVMIIDPEWAVVIESF